MNQPKETLVCAFVAPDCEAVEWDPVCGALIAAAEHFSVPVRLVDDKKNVITQFGPDESLALGEFIVEEVDPISYFAVRMRTGAGVSASKSTFVQITKFISIFVSFQLLLAVGLLMLALTGSANDFTILLAGAIFTLLLVGTGGLAFIVGSKRRINSFFTYITKAINKLLHFFRPNYPETINIEKAKETFDDLHEQYKVLSSDLGQLKRPLFFALMCNIAEIATIYTVYVAFGQFVNPGAVILAYAVASFAGLISVLPGGVGIFEGLMTVALAAAGIPPGVSLPVTVMYRVLNMIIQLPPGYYFYSRALNAKKRDIT